MIAVFFTFLWLFFLFIALGEKGGATFFHNLKLAIPAVLTAAPGIAAFLNGAISIIKNKERSILVFMSVIIGFLVLAYVSLEMLFPH